MRKIWDIPGGVHPPENKAQSTSTPIVQVPLPPHIILPLNQHVGAPALPIVEVGAKVLKGQLIADAQGLISAPVHASTSGTVTAIENRAIPHASGLSAPCIVIECDGEDRGCELTPCEDYRSVDKHSLVEKIRRAGVAGLGGAGFPTAVKLNPKANQKIHTLILNGTECEPYITADDMLMRERAEEIIAGIHLLAHLLDDPGAILVGIEDNKPEAIASMQQAASGSHIEVVTFPTKYPSGGEKQLIQILTGEEVPSGQIPAQMGVVVQNVATAVAAYRAVRFGEPLTSRITTVVGESLGVQQNIEALIGTPIDFILDQHGFNASHCARLIIGGPMMGYAMERHDIPLIKTTNCILVPSYQEMPAADPVQACIRCGLCAEACPASLLPQQLYWHARAEDIDKLKAHHLFDCIECGACAFVCPSNIPLVQYYRASKGTIRQIETDKQKSDQSRERFEFRKARIAKAEAAKEEKRLARKKAAEEAKRQLATKAKDEDLGNSKAESSVKDHDAQRRKLERAISSAKSAVEHVQTQLATARGEAEQARIDTLEAKLKQTQRKLSETTERLTQFDAGEQSDKHSDQGIREKIALSAEDKQQKTLDTLQKRIATAEQKYAEAIENNSPTAEALKVGVEKLQQKFQEAQQAGDSSAKSTDDAQTLNAAEQAIERAKAKTHALAAMSDDEKANAQVESLKRRLEKARARFAQAEADKDEHVEAFRNSVEKLEEKLKQAEAKR